MSGFVFPFEFQPVPEALAILNDMDIAPFEITEKHLESWWAEGKIQLCFNWGRFWKAGLADELAKTEGYAELGAKEKITALNAVSASPEANISLVVPSYSDLSFIWRGHSDDPLPCIEAKPYGLDQPFVIKRVPHTCEDYCDYGTQHWENFTIRCTFRVWCCRVLKLKKFIISATLQLFQAWTKRRHLQYLRKRLTIWPLL